MMLCRSRVPLWASLLLLLVTTLPPANSADLRIAALLPDQNVFYDALYELVDMTIREEQADGVLAAHNVGLDYTIYEFDQGYLESDVGTFANNSAIGLIGPLWSNDTQVALTTASNLSLPLCDGGATSTSLSTFPNFFRTIPSDTLAASATLALIQSKNWPAAVLITTTDVYGDRMVEAYIQAQQRTSSPVRIVGPFYFDPISLYSPSEEEDPDFELELTPEQNSTYGCKKVLNAVKSTGVGIIVIPVDAAQVWGCFPYAEEMGMLGDEYVWITHDAGTEFMWRFGEEDVRRWSNSMIMSYPRDQIPGPGLDTFTAAWTSFDASQYPTLDWYRASSEIPPYLLYVRDCVRMLMRGYDKVIGTDEEKAEDLALGNLGTILPRMTAADFDFPNVDSATGKLTINADGRQRDYDFSYGWDGAWIPFATWKGGNEFTVTAQNRYRDGSTNAPSGGAVPGSGGGGSSSGGITPFGIGLIVCALLAVLLCVALGFYLYRLMKLQDERKALVEARQLLVAWSSNPHNTQLVRQLTVKSGSGSDSGGRPNDDDGGGSLASEAGVSTPATPVRQQEMVQVKTSEAQKVLAAATIVDMYGDARENGEPPENDQPYYVVTDKKVDDAVVDMLGITEPARAKTTDRSTTVAASRVLSAPSAPYVPPPVGTATRRKKKKSTVVDDYFEDEEESAVLTTSVSEATIVDSSPRKSKSKRFRNAAIAVTAADAFSENAARASSSRSSPAPAAPLSPSPAPAPPTLLNEATPATNDEAAVAAATVEATGTATTSKSLGARMMTIVTSRGVRKKPVVMESST